MSASRKRATVPPHRIHLGQLRLEHGQLVGEIRFAIGEPATAEQIEACVEEFRAWLVARAAGAHR